MVVILVFVAWFYSSTGHPPEAEHAMFDSVQACVAAGHAATAKAEASSKVEGAQYACIVAKPVDKT